MGSGRLRPEILTILGLGKQLIRRHYYLLVQLERAGCSFIPLFLLSIALQGGLVGFPPQEGLAHDRHHRGDLLPPAAGERPEPPGLPVPLCPFWVKPLMMLVGGRIHTGVCET